MYQYRFSELPENKLQDWLTVSKELLGETDFGWFLDKSPWLHYELQTVIDSTESDLQKAKKIFAFVRDNFTSTDTTGLYLSQDLTLQNIYKKKNGTVGDINLLLIAMLRHENMHANPVILSTRSHGRVHPVYPMMTDYDYVICRVVINDSAFYLDASNAYLGFNRLPEKMLQWNCEGYQSRYSYVKL